MGICTVFILLKEDRYNEPYKRKSELDIVLEDNNDSLIVNRIASDLVMYLTKEAHRIMKKRPYELETVFNFYLENEKIKKIYDSIGSIRDAAMHSHIANIDFSPIIENYMGQSEKGDQNGW